LRQSLEEQETTVHDLRREAEEARKALEVEKEQVEGGLSSVCFSLVDLAFRDSLPTSFSCSWLSGLQTTLGNTTTQGEAVQTAYNSSQRELKELWAAALEDC
jgi:hypothetical protein